MRTNEWPEGVVKPLPSGVASRMLIPAVCASEAHTATLEGFRITFCWRNTHVVVLTGGTYLLEQLHGRVMGPGEDISSTEYVVYSICRYHVLNGSCGFGLPPNPMLSNTIYVSSCPRALEYRHITASRPCCL